MTFARYLLAKTPGEPPLPRADVYRRLVRANLRIVIDNAFPVTRVILGDRWASLVDDFFDAGGPSCALYREVPGDLVSWAQVVEEPYSDLLHYEWLELLAARHPADVDVLPAAGGLFLPNPTMQIALYGRPVHTMSVETPAPVPFDTPSAYLVWRRPKTDEVVFHRAGLVIGRAFELASWRARQGTALSVREIAAEVAREANLARDVVHIALAGCVDEVAERDGASR